MIAVSKDLSTRRKSCWRPEERQQFHLRGEPAEWIKEALGKIKRLVFLVAPFGAGKTTHGILLMRQGIALSVRKRLVRPMQPIEAASFFPVDQSSHRSWFNDEDGAAIERLGVGINPPYEEWLYWEDYLEIASPPAEKLYEIEPLTGHAPIDLFLDSFCLEKIAKTIAQAQVMGMDTICFQHCPSDAKKMIEILEQLAPGISSRIVCFYLDCPVKQRTTRILDRIRHQYGTDRPGQLVYGQVKVLEGASTPYVLITGCPIHWIDTSDSTSPEEAGGKVCRILGVKPVGG